MNWYVILDDDAPIECASRTEAHERAEAHLAKGHPAVRKASIYQAPDAETLTRWIAGWRPVQFVFVGIPRNYYESEEWAEKQKGHRQARLGRGEVECSCGQWVEPDDSYCPNCGRENYGAVAA